MTLFPKEIMDLIVEYSIEKTHLNPNKPQSPLLLHYNINPWRAISQELRNDYRINPPPTVLQLPVCLIS